VYEDTQKAVHVVSPPVMRAASPSRSQRLCLISHGQPAANPRLVRDASVLAEAGYSVRVVAAQYRAQLVEHDRKLASGAAWRYEAVDLLKDGWTHRWDYLRVRRRLSAGLANWLPTEGLVARGYAYGHTEVTKLAATQPADLYVAYQQQALPAAVWSARKNNSIFALDAQDLLADSSGEPTKLAVSLERRYLKDCAYISTMSASAAKRLQETNNLAERPFVLHNTPRLKERFGVADPSQRPRSELVSIYWFGQTIGPQSRAEQVLKAMPHLPKSLKLVLRGNPIEAYVGELVTTARALGVSGQLEILPREEPTEMVRLAADHDILLGTQPGNELFNQMAIGNKVFTGMMAGLALALSDTIAHRELLAELPRCGFLFADGDIDALVSHLKKLLSDRETLQQMKRTSWEIAEQRFNWEEEAKILLGTVERVFSLYPASGR
jgi:glycosyltransferase involved in cell wall biosynthesis